jgi:hypothetical protein
MNLLLELIESQAVEWLRADHNAYWHTTSVLKAPDFGREMCKRTMRSSFGLWPNNTVSSKRIENLEI